VKLGKLVRFREKTVKEWIARQEDKGRKTRKLDAGRVGS
jgi:predicted DNA-binding transcriptional regulator AlpA